MKPILNKLATLGVESQGATVDDLAVDAFRPAFDAIKDSPERALWLAAGLDALLDETTPPEPDEANVVRPSGNRRSADDYMPDDVADALLAVLDSHGSAYYEATGSCASFAAYPIETILRAVARAGVKIPTTRAAQFAAKLATCDPPVLARPLVEALNYDYVREVARTTLAPFRARVLMPTFLNALDSNRVLTDDDFERLARESATIFDRERYLLALRHFNPTKGRETIREYYAKENPDRRLRLVRRLDERLDVDDVPFLEEIAAKDRAYDVKTRAFEFLAKLRTTDYAKRVAEIAELNFQKDAAADSALKINAKTRKELGLDYSPNSMRSFDKPEQDFLYKTLQRTPLERWEEIFGKTPNELVEECETRDDFSYVLNGLRASYLLFGGPRDWLEPLANARREDVGDLAYLEFVLGAMRQIDPREVAPIRAIVDSYIAGRIAFLDKIPFTPTDAILLYEPLPQRESVAEYVASLVAETYKDATLGEHSVGKNRILVERLLWGFVALYVPLAPAPLRQNYMTMIRENRAFRPNPNDAYKTKCPNDKREVPVSYSAREARKAIVDVDSYPYSQALARLDDFFRAAINE